MSVGKLYIMDLSPPCRAVLLTAKALDLQIDVIRINLFKRDHLKPEFLKLNPAHAVPTYEDNDGTAIGDSHAIMAFLVDKYGRTAADEALYPKNLAQRARINQLMYFDAGNVYALHLSIVKPLYARLSTSVGEQQLASADIMYSILNDFLDGHDWVAGGKSYTIADFALVTSIQCISVVAPMDADKFAHIAAWMRRCAAISFYNDVNGDGHQFYATLLKDMCTGRYELIEKFMK